MFTEEIEKSRTYATAARASVDMYNTDGAVVSLHKAEAAFEEAKRLITPNSPPEVQGELLILRGELDMIKANLDGQRKQVSI